MDQNGTVKQSCSIHSAKGRCRGEKKLGVWYDEYADGEMKERRGPICLRHALQKMGPKAIRLFFGREQYDSFVAQVNRLDKEQERYEELARTCEKKLETLLESHGIVDMRWKWGILE